MKRSKDEQEVWDLIGTYHPDALVSDDELEADLAKVKARIRPASPKTSKYYWIAAAAVVLVTVMIGIQLIPSTVEVEAGYGEVATISLPDGSELILNSGSRAMYQEKGFGSTHRHIELIGEGYFDVKPNEQVPMTVTTHNSTVTVLGTSFNIRSWPTDITSSSVVMLESGRVQFSAITFPDVIMEMVPGYESEVSMLTPVPSEPKPVQLSRIAAWRNKGMYLTDEPMPVLLGELERRFSKTFILSDAQILNTRVSVLMDGPLELDDILQQISAETSIGFRYNDEDTVTLFDQRRRTVPTQPLR